MVYKESDEFMASHGGNMCHDTQTFLRRVWEDDKEITQVISRTARTTRTKDKQSWKRCYKVSCSYVDV
ncbi:hypothetical protein HID58_003696 [Brassica napus]|uniref:Uncharacterized protein n=1 Tax=Brassica napus TaxID=3708 RepID=A0ABQ8EQV7_BRANA|nr:hypothetical protein HID58_003696 [Brassica napus]